MPGWLPGVVSGFSELALLVKLSNGKICHCHIDHIRLHSDSDPQQLQEERMLVQSVEGGNHDPAVCTEPGSVITGSGVDLSTEDFVTDL